MCIIVKRFIIMAKNTQQSIAIQQVCNTVNISEPFTVKQVPNDLTRKSLGKRNSSLNNWLEMASLSLILGCGIDYSVLTVYACASSEFIEWLNVMAFDSSSCNVWISSKNFSICNILHDYLFDSPASLTASSFSESLFFFVFYFPRQFYNNNFFSSWMFYAVSFCVCYLPNN